MTSNMSNLVGMVGVAAACAALCGCGGGGGLTGTGTVITAQPQSQAAVTGSAVTFTVGATGSNLSYQWQLKGVPIPGATSTSYTIASVSYSDNAAPYTVVVTGDGGSVTTAAAEVTLQLSPSQMAYETLYLAGSNLLYWNLQYTGAEVDGHNFIESWTDTLPQSPLTAGPQTYTSSAPANMSATLSTAAVPTPGRYLKNAAILVVPGEQATVRASYVGSDVEIDSLASDNSTVAHSELRTDISTNALSGLVTQSPDEFASWYDALFSNSSNLNAANTYQAGSSYIKFTTLYKGDTYQAFDCRAATSGADISPCATGTTLEDLLTPGFGSISDQTTYHLADGTISIAEGVRVWVATNPRPVSASGTETVQYRIYFEMGGNVYTGRLYKDGTVDKSASYLSNPSGATITDQYVFFPYEIRLNKAARDSIAAALTF